MICQKQKVYNLRKEHNLVPIFRFRNRPDRFFLLHVEVVFSNEHAKFLPVNYKRSTMIKKLNKKESNPTVIIIKVKK